MARQGRMFILSAPSGAGKTTVAQRLLGQLPRLKRSISYTTRPPRPHEEEGKDYFFVTPATFQQMVAAGEFLEWAVVHGHYYGTSRRQTTQTLAAGWDLLLVIDVQGASSLKKQRLAGVFIFLLPPSLASLEARLRQRGSESEEEIARRLDRALEEMLHYSWYDYIIINERVSEAVEELKAIIMAERCRLHARDRDLPIFAEIETYAQKLSTQR